MAFSNWKSLKKIDAHIHILPDAVQQPALAARCDLRFLFQYS